MRSTQRIRITQFLANNVEEEFAAIAAQDGQQLWYRLLKPKGMQPASAIRW